MGIIDECWVSGDAALCVVIFIIKMIEINNK